jgi:hypothetical protein
MSMPFLANNMKYSAYILLLIVNISCFVSKKSLKKVSVPTYSDTLIYFVQYDSINNLAFNGLNKEECILIDANKVKTEFRSLETLIYNKLTLDTALIKSTLFKRFSEFYRQVTYFECNDTSYIRIFYLLILRKSFKVPEKYFKRIITGIFDSKNCDIYQYVITYNINTGEYRYITYNCD